MVLRAIWQFMDRDVTHKIFYGPKRSTKYSMKLITKYEVYNWYTYTVHKQIYSWFYFIYLIWGRCNLKRSRRAVIFLPVYKISSLKITPPKTPNSGQFSYPLSNIVSFLFEKKNRLEFRFRSHDFSFNLFPVWQPYGWRFWSAIVPIH